MSVSSSQGLTWRVTTDFATSSFLPDASFSAVLAALASWYLATRSALIRSASSSSSSSSPNRSMSSSSSSAGAAEPEAEKGEVPLGRLENSDLNEAMCLYQRAVCGLAEASGSGKVSVEIKVRTDWRTRDKGATYHRSRTRRPRHRPKTAGSCCPVSSGFHRLEAGIRDTRERVMGSEGLEKVVSSMYSRGVLSL